MFIYFIGEVRCKGMFGSFYVVCDYFVVNLELGMQVDLKYFVVVVYLFGLYVIFDWVGNYMVWDYVLVSQYFDWYICDV